MTMIDELPTPAEVIAAAARLAGQAIRTPMLTNNVLDARIGGHALIKPEVLQHTGSFKFRGAYNRLSQMTADEARRGVVAFSSGNHAQGVAYAAQLLNMPALIVMPSDAPRAKIANTKKLGAEVILYDRAKEDRETIAANIARERGAVVVPAFNDRHVMAGQGTIGLELADDAAARGLTIDTVLVCCSGGGMASGIALGFEARGMRPDIYVVEPDGFDDFGRSLRAGHILSNDKLTGSICDALMAPSPGPLTFAVTKPRLAGGVSVSDDEVREAVRFAYESLKLVVEPGGAVALTAALTGKVPTNGRITALILSGGNVDAELFAECLGQR
jgi:threonine dehydratase